MPTRRHVVSSFLSHWKVYYHGKKVIFTEVSPAKKNPFREDFHLETLSILRNADNTTKTRFALDLIFILDCKHGDEPTETG